MYCFTFELKLVFSFKHNFDEAAVAADVDVVAVDVDVAAAVDVLARFVQPGCAQLWDVDAAAPPCLVELLARLAHPGSMEDRATKRYLMFETNMIQTKVIWTNVLCKS